MFKKVFKLAIAILTGTLGGYLVGTIALATAGRPAAVWGAFFGGITLSVLASWVLSPETTEDPEVARKWIGEASQ